MFSYSEDTLKMYFNNNLNKCMKKKALSMTDMR